MKQPIHHPDASTLMSFAAGSLPEALSAVVAAHVEMCSTCGRELRTAERIGAALFEQLEPAALTAQMSGEAERIPRRERWQDQAYAECAPGSLPRAIQRLVGCDLDDVQWKRLGLGVWHMPLPLSEGATGDLRLLKIAPGQIMPEHGHGGCELTLVLAGAYRDEIGLFAAGDVADLGDDIEHMPISCAERGCICLIASEEKARFKGLFARMVQPFTGL
ncbi:MAG: ChrR family anti-sigma-E factor [Hyphomicrobiaceae bacterium]|nr:ChrR family anti-sigma-E factor [Hyphomicrobiaceae bacterium]